MAARFLPDLPSVTLSGQLPSKRQQVPTPSPLPSDTTIQEDPWQCVTENITQYFDVPQPTGNVLSRMNSYGAEVAKPCRATATGLDLFSCTISDPKSWCGFTTAAPADVLSSYASYVSAVVSFWTAKSSTVSVLSTSCPVAWAKPNMAQHEWLKIAAAHADCYLNAHPQTATDTNTGTTQTKSTSTKAPSGAPTSSGKSASRGRRAAETIAMVSTGLAVLANAA
ncbi:hypothetical protein CkaCkLH20_03069 [Colletotrichum karsti]|uniref:DUF7735 domain-containing protein n=1 Tax=Colletotrichum karsti TaxID=1095194 RepID=A0A9P6LNS1_9PEZI|nr:uncharacterized protein CkaCkLH20_03069 [Colletotrichum karsti]KAF9879526.1 hypothetical protein CkaCkLH20_03069 [Colletotrichum karsti]